MTLVTMPDSINAGAIPATAAAAAGYVDGAWPDHDAIAARLPHATVISITVAGRPGARVGDSENGDMTPADFAVWARDEILARRRPTAYCSRASVPTVVDALRRLGIDPGAPLAGGSLGQVDWWVADWGPAAGQGQPHLPGGCVACQYDHDVAGCDLSVADLRWLQQQGVPTVALNAPVIGPPMIDPKGRGYWDVAADGGVFTHGVPGASLPFFGSAVGNVVAGDHITGGSVWPDGEGYLLVSAAGRHYAFGSAKYEGND
jgi:hypothetical protein